MLKFVVVCAIVAVATAKPWPPTVLRPTLYSTIPVVYGGYQPRFVSPVVQTSPVVQATQVLYEPSPYVHVIKKRQFGVLESSIASAVTGAVTGFNRPFIAANAGAANTALNNVQPQGQGQGQGNGQGQGQGNFQGQGQGNFQGQNHFQGQGQRPYY